MGYGLKPISHYGVVVQRAHDDAPAAQMLLRG